MVDVFIERGDAAKKQRDYRTALSHYQEALDVAPNDTKAKNRLDNCPEPQPIVTPPPAAPPKAKTSEDELDRILDALEPEPATNAEEEQQRVLTYILRRRGQPQFRQALLDAYNHKCAITDCDAEAALEAAHIIPYAETSNNALPTASCSAPTSTPSSISTCSPSTPTLSRSTCIPTCNIPNTNHFTVKKCRLLK